MKIPFGIELGLLPYRVNGAVDFGEMVANGLSPIGALRAAPSIATNVNAA